MKVRRRRNLARSCVGLRIRGVAKAIRVSPKRYRAFVAGTAKPTSRQQQGLRRIFTSTARARLRAAGFSERYIRAQRSDVDIVHAAFRAKGMQSHVVSGLRVSPKKALHIMRGHMARIAEAKTYAAVESFSRDYWREFGTMPPGVEVKKSFVKQLRLETPKAERGK